MINTIVPCPIWIRVGRRANRLPVHVESTTSFVSEAQMIKEVNGNVTTSDCQGEALMILDRQEVVRNYEVKRNSHG